MQAVTYRRYGEPSEVLEFGSAPTPRPGPKQVQIEVKAAGLDQGVWHLVAGRPYLARLMFGLRAPTNLVPGLDVSGVVTEVGAEAGRFEPGDEVFGIATGSFAELTCADVSKLVQKPQGLPHTEAAAVPVSGITGLEAVRDHGGVEEGQRVLVIGASGGVGSYAVQVARALGARVTAVCSGEKSEFVRGLGADDVIDYRREKLTDRGERFDVIADIGGRRSIRELRAVLAPRGHLVIVGGEGGGPILGGVDRQVRATLLSPFVGQKLGTFIASESGRALFDLSEMIEAGKVHPAVDRAFPLGDAAEAIRYLREGQARGKVVLVPGTTSGD